MLEPTMHFRAASTRSRAPAALWLAPLLAACSQERIEQEEIASIPQAITGNIHPNAIQIDGPSGGPPGADLYPSLGTPLNAGAAVDWVADANPSSGTGCLGSDAIASCIEPNVTGAPGGTGHWNGLRIVDGIDGDDLDIFLTGGKENEPDTWNVGAGSVGSSKYDIVEAYLANNQSSLFFGMERRGNNGTTAFDFEFNQLAPMSRPSCPQDPLVPCRSVDDVLFTFEMQGSGNSGSARPFRFTWDGAEYVPGAASGVLSSINGVATPGGPWGHVDSHGDWVLGDLDRFSFAEAAAPLTSLPGVDACGGSAFVQVRTRSASVATSDLKDTTRIFEFEFLNVVAEAALTPSCDQRFGYSASANDADGNPIPSPVCSWTFSNGATSEQCSGSLAADPGTITAEVVVTDPSNADCSQTVTTAAVAVYPPLDVEADLTATCVESFGYLATPSGGSDSSGVSYDWTFSGGGSTTPASSQSQSGSVEVGTPAVAYSGTVVITDPRTDIVCTASDDDGAVPYAPLHVDLALSAPAPTCPGMSSDAVSYGAVPSGGNGDYSYAWQGAPCAGSSCAIDPGDSSFCEDASVSVTLSDSSELCPAAESEPERYQKVTVVTASDAP